MDDPFTEDDEFRTWDEANISIVFDNIDATSGRILQAQLFMKDDDGNDLYISGLAEFDDGLKLDHSQATVMITKARRSI